MEGRGLASRPGRLDADAHDPLCRHLLVEDASGLLATARLRVFPDGQALGESYAGQAHDLRRFRRCPAPLLELGRLCVRPGGREVLALRAAWGCLAGLVDAEGVRLLFGCASFEGSDPAPHLPALALLGREHLAPGPRISEKGAPGTLDLALLPPPPDRLAAMRAMPPLLRSYLALGGWVGRHAVIDRDLDTLHVLTAVETARVPPARARALRALSSG